MNEFCIWYDDHEGEPRVKFVNGETIEQVYEDFKKRGLKITMWEEF